MAMRPCQQNQAHGKFAASLRTGEFAGTSHSLALVTIGKSGTKEVDLANLKPSENWMNRVPELSGQQEKPKT